MLALLFWGATAFARAFDAWVEAPEQLVKVVDHAEFVRAEVEGPFGHYWIEVAEARRGQFCQGGGLGVAVRRDLKARNESFDLDPVPPAVRRSCDHLEDFAPVLKLQMAQAQMTADAQAVIKAGPDGSPTGKPETLPDEPSTQDAPRLVPMWRWRPMHAVVGVWMIAFLACLWRWRKGFIGNRADFLVGFAFFGFALGLRPAAPTMILGGDAAYERLLSALGRGSIDHYYGETWPAVLGLFSAAEGWSRDRMPGTLMDWVHPFNRLVSAASVVGLYALARRLSFGVGTATIAAAALATSSVARTMASAEDHLVLVSALQLCTLFAAYGRTSREAALAVVSAVLLGHLRPEQLPIAGLCLLPLLAQKRWGWFLVGGLGLATRLGYLPPGTSSAPIQWSRFLDPSGWLEMPLNHLAPVGFTTFAGASIVGLLGLYPLFRLRATPALLLLASLFLYLPKTLPLADPLRFSLPTLPWLALAVVAALATAWRWVERTHRGWVWRAMLGLCSLFFAVGGVWDPARPLWVWEGEYHFLVAELSGRGAAALAEAQIPPVPDILDDPPEASPSGWYNGSQDPNLAYGTWFSLQSGIRWRAFGKGPPQSGDLVYRGFADRADGTWPGEACGLDVLVETEVDPATDGWVDLGTAPVRLGFYRVRDCAQ